MTNHSPAILPIALIVCSNVFYNIAAKATPPKVNTMASLVAAYAVAALCTAVIMRVQAGSFSVGHFKGINWTTALLAVCIIGIETGYILAFRAGWNISVCSLAANITLAVLLVLVGVLFYRESVSLKQISGIAMCLGGLLLLNGK